MRPSLSKPVSPIVELENLAHIGKLKIEPSAENEINGLIASGMARLRDANNEQLSFESRFDLACNAAHALSLAALRFHGCRSDNRYLVFQALPHTVGLLAAHWRKRTINEILPNTKATLMLTRNCSKTCLLPLKWSMRSWRC
jgi:hypothetical protein